MKAPLFSKTGKRIGEVQIPESVFGIEPNKHLLWEIVRMYQWNARHSIPKAKTRSEVRGSGAKIWPQKGLGRARHGDRYAPIFVGGGKAHGPKGIKTNYRIPKKIRAKALASALSDLAKEGKVFIFEKFEFKEIKTKEFLKFLDRIGLEREKVLFLSKDLNREFYLSGRNLRGVFFRRAQDVTAVDVLNSEVVGVEKEAIPILEARVKR
jgi:large subunit ribosomal protein L4